MFVERYPQVYISFSSWCSWNIFWRIFVYKSVVLPAVLSEPSQMVSYRQELNSTSEKNTPIWHILLQKKSVVVENFDNAWYTSYNFK